MKITRENYEAFFLDYLEGNLADHLVSEFHDFIKANPDLADELDDVDAAAGYAFNSEVFDGKQQLKKPELPITEDELDLLLAREAEGEVSDEELQVIEKLATQFTSVALSRKAFAQSFFTPEKINFEYKSTLYYNEQADMQSLPMRMAAGIEGDLDARDATTLKHELETDAQLQSDYATLQLTKLAAGVEAFDQKPTIAIPAVVNTDEVQNLLIAKVEGDLNHTQNERLSALLAADENLRTELSRFYKTKLHAEAISFEHKDRLRRKDALVVPLRKAVYYVAAAAAVVALIVWFNTGTVVTPVQVAEQDLPAKENKQGNTPVDLTNQKTQPENALPSQQGVDEITTPFHEKPVWKHDVAVQTPVPQVPVQDNNQQPAPLNVPEENIAHDKPQLPANTPDMSPLYAPDANDVVANSQLPNSTTQLSGQPQKGNQPATIWRVLGNAAEKKIEQTAAYALMERQTERLASQKEKFSYQHTDEELKVKLGRFELNHNKGKRTNEGGIIDRLKQRITRD